MEKSKKKLIKIISMRNYFFGAHVLNVASNRVANDFYSMISKINYCYCLIAVIFIEMIFSVTLYVVWYVIIFIK